MKIEITIDSHWASDIRITKPGEEPRMADHLCVGEVLEVVAHALLVRTGYQCYLKTTNEEAEWRKRMQDAADHRKFEAELEGL